MSDEFSDWLLTDNWTDYRQQRRIRELDDELTSLSSSLYRQQAESGRLRSQLAELQGSLEERLTRLGRAFDAFVELSDIREILAMFDAPALLRHRTRQLLASGDHAAIVLPAEADVPGYWLSAAVRALVAVRAGGEAPADLATARRLEPHRTALLIVAGAALSQRPEVAAARLGDAIGELRPGVPVTAAQRVLWREAERGTFGPAGLDTVEGRLRACVMGTDGSLDDAVCAALDGSAARAVRIPFFEKDPDVVAALVAARRLGALRALCDSPDTPEAAGSLSLALLVRQLVDEGTEEERPLLRRAEELRAVIEARTDGAPQRFDTELEPPDRLLVADLPTSALARRVTAERCRALADTLLAGTAVDTATETTVESGTHRIRVTVDGFDADAVRRARTAVRTRYETVTTVDPIAGVLGAAGVLLAVGGAFAPVGWAVLGILIGVGLLVGAGVRVYNRRLHNREQNDLCERAEREVDRRAEAAHRDLADAVGAFEQLRARAAEDHKAVVAALAAAG